MNSWRILHGDVRDKLSELADGSVQCVVTSPPYWGLRDYRCKGQIKPKDLCGIPWRVAFALQADGWYLRSDIIWSKPNPMPESVTDRPTKAHEYIFLLSKSARYYYYAAVLAEVFMRGGNIHVVSRTRVEMCEASGGTATECATLELQLQWARDRVARDMARLTVVSQ